MAQIINTDGQIYQSSSNVDLIPAVEIHTDQQLILNPTSHSEGRAELEFEAIADTGQTLSQIYATTMTVGDVAHYGKVGIWLEYEIFNETGTSILAGQIPATELTALQPNTPLIVTFTPTGAFRLVGQLVIRIESHATEFGPIGVDMVSIRAWYSTIDRTSPLPSNNKRCARNRV